MNNGVVNMSDQEVKDRGEWYSNRELFEQLNEMRDEFHDLRSEMRETRFLIQKYNGLREELMDVREDLTNTQGEIELLRAKAEVRAAIWIGIRKWGGWIIAVLTGGITIGAAISKWLH